MKLGKKILRYTAVFIFVFIASFLLSYLLRNSDFVNGILNPKTSIEFQDAVFDFREIPQGKEAITYFVYTNTGKSPLKIANISSNCGCTVQKWSREKLESGKKDSIMVMYDAETYGYFSKAIYVFSNAESSPDALYIEGNVIDMKKIKKNIFGIGLALAMILGVVFSFVPQKSFAEEGGGNTSWWCFSAYSWKMVGHLWYCQGNGTCEDVTGTGYGNQAVCNQAVGN